MLRHPLLYPVSVAINYLPRNCCYGQNQFALIILGCTLSATCRGDLHLEVQRFGLTRVHNDSTTQFLRNEHSNIQKNLSGVTFLKPFFKDAFSNCSDSITLFKLVSVHYCNGVPNVTLNLTSNAAQPLNLTTGSDFSYV